MAIAGIPVPGPYAYPAGSARRRFTRRPVDGQGICVELDAALRARILDLSEGGMRVAVPRLPSLPPGSALSFNLPGGSAITVNCEMAWSDASGVAGLRFLTFSHNSQGRLANWLSGGPAEASPAMEASASIPPQPVAALSVAPPAAESYAIEDWQAEADDPGLEMLVRRMMAMTAADGAAIVLRNGDAILCRARAGSAPMLGTRLDPQRGLSGKCVGSGEPVLCRDTETDPIVNVEACRALRLRAALLVPVKQEARVEGVLEVFSSRPDVFDLGDIAALQRLTLSVAEFLPQAESSPNPAPQPPPASAPAPTAGSAAATTPGPSVAEGAGAEMVAPPPVVWPKMALRLIADPHYREWKRVVYWSSVVLRKILSLATLAVPLSYLVYFLIGPVIRPGAVEGTTVFHLMTRLVEPGMEFADDFFSFRAVVRGWNLMFLLVAVIGFIGRGLALRPLNFLLTKLEALTRPQRRYGYVPYLPHRTDFR